MDMKQVKEMLVTMTTFFEDITKENEELKHDKQVWKEKFCEEREENRRISLIDLQQIHYKQMKEENKKLKEENVSLKKENEAQYIITNDIEEHEDYEEYFGIIQELEKEVDELRDGEDSFRDGIIDGLQAEIKQLKDIENHPDYVLHFSELVADLRAENTKLKEALNKVKRDLSPQR